MPKGRFALNELELRVAKGRSRILSGANIRVKIVHEFGCGVVVHFPQCSDDLMRTCMEERPGQTDETLPRICARACAMAARDRYQSSMQLLLDDVAGVELVGVAVACKDNRRFERAQPRR